MSEVLEDDIEDGAPVEAAADESAQAAKRQKTRTSYADGTLSVHEPGKDVITYDMRALSPETLEQLAAKGAGHYLTQHPKGHEHAFSTLQAGEFRARKPAKARELDSWRVAISHALVEELKKTDAPITLDAAKERARGMSRDAIISAKKMPAVVKHYARLNPVEGGLSGLLG